MSMFLNVDDLEQLSGYKNKSKQREWLSRHNVPFVINRWGQPLVLKKIIEKNLGIDEETKFNKKGLNQTALLKMMEGR